MVASIFVTAILRKNTQFRFPLTKLLSKDLENKFFDVTIL